MKRLLAAAAVIGIFAVLPLATAGATTGPELQFHARIGNIFGLVAPAERAQNGQLSNQSPRQWFAPLQRRPDHAAEQLVHDLLAAVRYSFPAGYVNNMNQYFKDLQATQGSNTNTYDNATQYYSTGEGRHEDVRLEQGDLRRHDDRHPSAPGARSGQLSGHARRRTPVASTATSPRSAGCVTDAQVQQEISNVVKAKGWPVNNNTEFFMYTAPNIGTCFPAQVGEDTGTGIGITVTAPLCSFSYFCAYHSWYFDSTINANSQIIYSNMPYAAQTAGNPLTCDLGDYPNHNPSDPEISVDEPRAERVDDRPVRNRLVGQQLERQRRRRRERRHVRVRLRDDHRPGQRGVEPDDQRSPLPHAARVGQLHQRLPGLGRLG